MEWTRNQLTISDSPDRVNVDTVCELLADSYWAATRSRLAIEKGVQHSLVLGLYTGGAMVGLVRITTDHAVFGWISDVIIHPAYRGQGLGTWRMECVLDHPTTRQLSRLGLATKDAHQTHINGRKHSDFSDTKP